MAEKLEVYRCEKCSNIVEVFHAGGGTLSCCGQAMKHLVATTTEGVVEKHLPVIEKIEGGFRVKVGEVKHPMTEEHYIEWIELIAGGKVYIQFLNPGEEPAAIFKVDTREGNARSYCNIHGLWKNK